MLQLHLIDGALYDLWPKEGSSFVLFMLSASDVPSPLSRPLLRPWARCFIPSCFTPPFYNNRELL